MNFDPRAELTIWQVPELGNASYVLHLPDENTSVIVDPTRDVDGYLAELPSSPGALVFSLDTHVHADFVSGSPELVQSAGAQHVASAGADLRFGHKAVSEGERLSLGRWQVRVLETPGHTPEHVSYLLIDPERRPRALFSGGALMVGTAARTDLVSPALSRVLAHEQYRTTHARLQDLPADVLLLPTHGGGSFCGASTCDRRTSTLGEERATNPLLQSGSEQEFLRKILEQGSYPLYFRRMRAVNAEGARLSHGRPPRPRLLSLTEFDAARAMGATVLDARDPEEFDRGHIPGSISIGLGGPFSSWVGWLFRPDRPMILVASGEDSANLAARQLFRIGVDTVEGFLKGGYKTWSREGRRVDRTLAVDARAVADLLARDAPLTVLDVREPYEWVRDHVPGSLNIPLPSLVTRIREIPKDLPVLVHCQSGYRAAIAASLLEAEGFERPYRAVCQFGAWDPAPRTLAGETSVLQERPATPPLRGRSRTSPRAA